MPPILRKVSTITEKGQTTVPKSVRQALGIGAGDRVAYVIDENSRVVLERDDSDEDDPVIGRFLSLLAQDMQENPARAIVAIPDGLQERIADLAGRRPVDLDEPIDGEVDL